MATLQGAPLRTWCYRRHGSMTVSPLQRFVQSAFNQAGCTCMHQKNKSQPSLLRMKTFECNSRAANQLSSLSKKFQLELHFDIFSPTSLHNCRRHATSLPRDRLCTKVFAKDSCLFEVTGRQTSTFVSQCRLFQTSAVFHRKNKRKDRKRSTSNHNQSTDTEYSEENGYGEMEEFDKEVDPSDLAFDYANKLMERGHRTIAGHKVLVIQPVLKGGQTSSQHSSTLALQLAEAVSLVHTLPSWLVVDTQRVHMRSATKRAMFGKGTLQDLTKKIQTDQEVSTVFIDVDRLNGLQKGFLEEAWGRPVLDRFELVLEIFKSHASSKEAKLQIALAEVHFRKSHLRQAVEELDQQGGGQQYIGGGGETLLEKQQRLLRDKEGALRKALAKLKQKRGLLRAGRERKNFPHVAVVGYTNAGKTSLIKALTGSSKLDPQDRLFATLDVTSHVGQLSNRMRVIFLDTVGFIANLPHELIASFSATLEDVLHADLILLVTDVSHPDWPSQRLNVLSVLHDLGVAQNLLDNVVEVSNKVDLIPAGSGDELTKGSLPVSAKEGTGVTFLKEVIEQRLLDVTDLVKCAVKIPQAGLHLGWLYKEATVEEVSPIEGDAEHLRVDAVFSKSAFAKFCAQFGDSRIT